MSRHARDRHEQLPHRRDGRDVDRFAGSPTLFLGLTQQPIAKPLVTSLFLPIGLGGKTFQGDDDRYDAPAPLPRSTPSARIATNREHQASFIAGRGGSKGFAMNTAAFASPSQTSTRGWAMLRLLRLKTLSGSRFKQATRARRAESDHYPISI
jgi:hypothetical protein